VIHNDTRDPGTTARVPTNAGLDVPKPADDDGPVSLDTPINPGGDNYFPVFPYPSYTRMTEADMLDLKAWLFSQAPVSQTNKPHDIELPFGFRFLLGFWKALYFTPGTMDADAEKSDAWNRGAYLVTALGHCGECHTPRAVLPSRCLGGQARRAPREIRD